MYHNSFVQYKILCEASILRSVDTRLHFYKGDNFCDFLFAYMHIKPRS